MEAEENMITLPEEEPDIFRLFQGWLYTRELPKDDRKALIKLWCFGDRRAVPLLQNQAIDTIREVNNERRTEPTNMVRYVFNNTTPDAPLRHFLIVSFAARCKGHTFMKWSEQ